MNRHQNNNCAALKKRDIVLIAVLLLLSFASLFIMRNARGGATARVIYDGKTVYESKLSDLKEKTVITPVDGVEITAENGTIGFTSSSCPSQECVKSGRLSSAYQTAACIPNKVLIIIIPDGTSRSDFDAVVY